MELTRPQNVPIKVHHVLLTKPKNVPTKFNHVALARPKNVPTKFNHVEPKSVPYHIRLSPIFNAKYAHNTRKIKHLLQKNSISLTKFFKMIDSS